MLDRPRIADDTVTVSFTVNGEIFGQFSIGVFLLRTTR